MIRRKEKPGYYTRRAPAQQECVEKLPLGGGATQTLSTIWLVVEAIHEPAPRFEIPISCGFHHKMASARKLRSGRARSSSVRPIRRRGCPGPPFPPRRRSTTAHYSQPSLLHPPSDPPIVTYLFLAQLLARCAPGLSRTSRGCDSPPLPSLKLLEI